MTKHFKTALFIYLSYIGLSILTSFMIESEVLAVYVKSVIKIGLSIFLIFRIQQTFKIDVFRNNLFISALMFVFIFLSVYYKVDELYTHGFTIFSTEHVIFLFSTIATGLFEELFFRLYLFLVLLRKFGSGNYFKIACLSSFLFALAHISNILNPDTQIFSILTQMLYAFGIGLILQSLFIRYSNVVLIIVLHALLNYWGTFNSKMLGVTGELNDYPFSEFLNNFLTFLIFIVFVSVPVSYVIIKGRKTEANFN